MIKRRALIAGAASLIATPAIVRGVTDDELTTAAASMLMMGFYGGSPSSRGAASMSGYLAAGSVGGVILFEDNLTSPASARTLIEYLVSKSKIQHPFVAVDQEGGYVVRLTPDHGFARLPAAKTVAQLSDAEAERLYVTTARELGSLGINVNFGPVVDLDRNPRNPIIGALGRSFGANPDKVVADVRIFIDAHRRTRVLTALKHFPGHGSARADSHRSLPDITGVWSEEELKPFATLIGSGYADMIMVGHLMDRDLTEDGHPASLSTRVVHDLLRKQLAYDGVVVTDDMQMGAVRRSYAPDESILLALEAGVDLFVFSNRENPDPQMPDRFHRVVRSAVASGRLNRYRILLSAQRIGRLKQSLV